MLTDSQMAGVRISWPLLTLGVLQLLQMRRSDFFIICPSHLVIIMHSALIVSSIHNNDIETLQEKKNVIPIPTTVSPQSAAATLSSRQCTYNFVIQEADPSVKCPQIYESYKSQREEEFQHRKRHKRHKLHALHKSNSREMQDQPTRIMHQTYLRTMEDLINRVSQLETKLYKEMAENRELKNSLLLQEQWLKKTERQISNHITTNLSHLHTDVSRVKLTMEKQQLHYRSLDSKVAEVMLDVAEVNNYLATGKHRAQEEAAHQDKHIPVQATSQLNSGCSIPANTTSFRDCQDVLKKGHRRSGVYYITPIYSPCPIPVYCDMETPPGGWLVLQRRIDGKTSFNRNWYEYRMGFGDITREFWIGNDNLFLLTNQAEYKLRVDLWDFFSSRVFAEYDKFKVDGERDKFKLHVYNYTGTAGDGFSNHHGADFSTPDEDNDRWEDYHCAKEWHAGWWFNNCWFVILNGKYYNKPNVKYRGISWNEWKGEQLQSVEMKIRPVD